MTLSVATSGYIPTRSPICLATMGFLCGEAAEEALTGGVKARIFYEDVEPLWKQNEYEPDWVDLEIRKELKKLELHKPEIIDVSSILDEELSLFKEQQEIKRKKHNRKKALHMLLSGL